MPSKALFTQRSIVRTQQPQQAPQVNTGSALARRLTSAFVLTNSGMVFDARSGKAIIPTSATGITFNVARPGGVGVSSLSTVNGTVNFDIGRVLPVPSAGVEQTIAFGAFLPVAAAAYEEIASLAGQNLKIGTSNTTAGTFGLSLTGVADVVTTLTHPSAGDYNVVYAMKFGSTLETTVRGQSGFQYSSIAIGTPTTSTGTASYLLTAGGSEGTPVGTVLRYLLVWDRKLLRAEAASLADNPWQVFR